jgi:peptide/nickel transport system permease protein
MSEVTLPLKASDQPGAEKHAGSSALGRVGRYAAVKISMLIITVVISVYLTILIANMGGYVDEIRRGQIQEQVSSQMINNPQFRGMDPDLRRQRVEEMVRVREKAEGLDQPFLIRSFKYLSQALTLNLGYATNMTSDSGSRQVRLIILERLPSTLVLFATANIINFFLSIFIALILSRNYGSPLDRLAVALSPLSSAPGWFFGIFLILIFAAGLRLLPFGGMVDTPPPESTLAYAWSLLKHMALPALSLTLASIFGAVYAYRTFFLIYSSEDYVEMAKAKGLSAREIERRYVLRPTLPTIITNFALALIALWQGAIVLETVFNWPGLGRLIFRAIGLYDTPVIVATVVIYAYLLAITVFLLDFVYALVDPRVKVGQ